MLTSDGISFHGASAYDDYDSAPLTGVGHRLAAGTVLTQGLGVVADGEEFLGNQPVGHHTFFPTRRMSFGEFDAPRQRVC